MRPVTIISKYGLSVGHVIYSEHQLPKVSVYLKPSYLYPINDDRRLRTDYQYMGEFETFQGFKTTGDYSDLRIV